MTTCLLFVPSGITRPIHAVTQTRTGAFHRYSTVPRPTSFVFVLGGTASRDPRRTKTFQSTEVSQ
jgi:hypothetical protein